MKAVNWTGFPTTLLTTTCGSEHSISLQEAKVLESLQYDLEIFGRVLNDGTIIGKYCEAVTLAFQNVLGAPYLGKNTPRVLLLEGNETSSGRKDRRNSEPRRRNGGLGAVWSALICHRTVGTVTMKRDLRTDEVKASRL